MKFPNSFQALGISNIFDFNLRIAIWSSAFEWIIRRAKQITIEEDLSSELLELCSVLFN